MADPQVEVPLLEDPAIPGERGDDDPSRPTAPAERHRFCCSSACRATAAIEHGHGTGRIDVFALFGMSLAEYESTTAA